jgi:hypothetical protein
MVLSIKVEEGQGEEEKRGKMALKENLMTS